MNINHYTPMHYTKRHAHASVFFNSFEPLLKPISAHRDQLDLYISLVKICSIRKTTTIQGSQGSPASAVAALFAANDEAPANDFDEYVEIESKVVANQTFNFQFLKDEKASRYVMEMGDGVRLIVTQKSMEYLFVGHWMLVLGKLARI
ncbi:MAG: hypothetical protein IPN46_14020 [Saprospiraceae bacterium]|nr:hypothetical protein [Saprospiraceae bacterium]